MISFKCPNCDSIKFLNKHSFGKKVNSGPYLNVNTEIQCANCFMDIPSNLSENIKDNKYDDNKKLWNKFYKPEHLKISAKCSKCRRYYWEIEKYLFKNKISNKDIFYQTYNFQKGVGDLICKICDPSAFK